MTGGVVTTAPTVKLSITLDMLFFISRRNTVTSQDRRQFLDMSKDVVQKHLKYLVNKGYIEMKQMPRKDARSGRIVEYTI